MVKFLVTILYFTFTILGSAYAQVLPQLEINAKSINVVNKSGHWTVYTAQQDKQKICYIASTPIKSSGTYKKRGVPNIIVTNINYLIDEVSISPGFQYNKNIPVVLQFGANKEKTYKFSIIEGSVAWASNIDTDKEIISMLSKGLHLTVKSYSTKNTFATDTYSLLGFNKAYSIMKSTCARKNTPILLN